MMRSPFSEAMLARSPRSYLRPSLRLKRRSGKRDGGNSGSDFMDTNLAALLGVALGGIIGFFSALYIDVQRRQYELKKQVYLEALDTFSEAMRFWQKYRYDNAIPLDDEFYGTAFKFQSIIYKILLSKCSKEVYNIMDKNFTEHDSFKDPRKVHVIIKNELIPALMRDLNRWWQFWK